MYKRLLRKIRRAERPHPCALHPVFPRGCVSRNCKTVSARRLALVHRVCVVLGHVITCAESRDHYGTEDPEPFHHRHHDAPCTVIPL